MAKRKRIYTLFAPYRGGPLTNNSERGEDSPYWVYSVYAVSIKQAYYLAGNEVFADDERSVGIRKVETDWWHFRELSSADFEVAPYITEYRGRTLPLSANPRRQEVHA